MERATIIDYPFLKIQTIEVKGMTVNDTGVLYAYYKGKEIMTMEVHDVKMYISLCDAYAALSGEGDRDENETTIGLLDSWHQFVMKEFSRKESKMYQFDLAKISEKYFREKGMVKRFEDFQFEISVALFQQLRCGMLQDSEYFGFFFISEKLMDALPDEFPLFAFHKDKCGMCKAEKPKKRCGKCVVFYCDRECQVAHWPLHKKFCNSLQGMMHRI